MELAARAEELGWDGFFLWDHIRYRAPTHDVLDCWVALSAIATATERIRIGPMVTPISRRRPHKLARETVTLDHLSGGRLTLGVGLGGDRSGELGPFGEETDPKARARLLDDGLAKLAGYWAGEFEPAPVQSPRIPVWVASRWPNRRPLRRAARWDGLFPIDLPEPDALSELAAEVSDLRDDPDAPFDLVVEIDPGKDPPRWEAAGATWVLTSFGQSPLERDVRAVIEAGPS
jgi:alkanesulfonate monooxygenase SsuD/methylene tetrahydromethanopterin reductase-like flavin-dependent oxidoreductase (luciferase family)